MATRGTQDLKNALIKSYVVKSGTTTVVGGRTIFSVADNNDAFVDNSAANDDTAIGTFLEAIVGDGVKKVQVCLDGICSVLMKVGTGGTTRGKKQKLVADGITDADANGGGTLAHGIIGIALNSGVVGDLVGVMPANSSRVSAT